MKKFFKVWEIIGFILAAIALWPFLAPWICIKRAYNKQRIFMETEIGRNKWFRLIMCPVILITYIPALIIDLTVGYGIMAHVAYTIYADEGEISLNRLSEIYDEGLDNVVKEIDGESED